MAKANPVSYQIDVNDQRFLAPENMTAEINAAVGKELTIGEMAYVIYDNLARYYDIALKALESVTGETYDTLNIIGGGSNNKFLNELTMKLIGGGDIVDVKEGREIITRSFDISEA